MKDRDDEQKETPAPDAHPGTREGGHSNARDDDFAGDAAESDTQGGTGSQQPPPPEPGNLPEPPR
jgi:hypothetical protein